MNSAWSTWGVPGQPVLLHSETLSQKKVWGREEMNDVCNGVQI